MKILPKKPQKHQRNIFWAGSEIQRQSTNMHAAWKNTRQYHFPQQRIHTEYTQNTPRIHTEYTQNAHRMVQTHVATLQ